MPAHLTGSLLKWEKGLIASQERLIYGSVLAYL